MKRINNIECIQDICYVELGEIEKLYNSTRNSLLLITDSPTFIVNNKPITVLSNFFSDIDQVIELINHDRVSQNESYCIFSLSKHDTRGYYLRGAFVTDNEKEKILKRQSKIENILKKPTE